MVLHLIDSLIGHDGDVKYYFKDQYPKQLVELGFSEKEAQEVAWLNSCQNKGIYYGLGAGAAFLFFANPFYNRMAQSIPYMRHQPYLNVLMKLGTLALFYHGGQWWFTSKRQAGNFWASNLYSNNNYTKSKEAFVRNFEVMNRQFTEAEVDQFMENRVRERPNQERKWIYNPHLHGDNEEEFRKNIDLYFKKNVHPSEKPQAKQDIQTQNAEKLSAGEQLHILPYNVVKDVDHTGIKHKIKHIPISTTGAWQQIQ